MAGKLNLLIDGLLRAADARVSRAFGSCVAPVRALKYSGPFNVSSNLRVPHTRGACARPQLRRIVRPERSTQRQLG